MAEAEAEADEAKTCASLPAEDEDNGAQDGENEIASWWDIPLTVQLQNAKDDLQFWFEFSKEQRSHLKQDYETRINKLQQEKLALEQKVEVLQQLLLLQPVSASPTTLEEELREALSDMHRRHVEQRKKVQEEHARTLARKDAHIRKLATTAANALKDRIGVTTDTSHD